MRHLFLISVLGVAGCAQTPEPPPRGAPPEIIASQTCREHMISSRPPAYPKRAVAEGIMGYSIVAYDLDGSGQAKNARVIESKPARVFDEAAVQALVSSAFQPGVTARECRYVADFAFRRR